MNRGGVKTKAQFELKELYPIPEDNSRMTLTVYLKPEIIKVNLTDNHRIISRLFSE